MGGGDDDGAIARISERFGPVVRVATPPGSAALSAAYGPADGRMYLVRLDGYIACKTRPGKTAVLETCLDALLAP